MAQTSSGAVCTLCRERIALLRHPLLFSRERIVGIVRANLARGRLERCSGTLSASPAALTLYVDRVLSYVQLEQRRIHALETGDPCAWRRLYDHLARRAARVLQRSDHGETAGQASDLANQACMVIFEERYPFDVPFEAWIAVILKNLILTRLTRSTDALDRKPGRASLDAFRKTESGEQLALSDLLGDERSARQYDAVERRMELVKAIQALPSAAQRDVIGYTFFDELSDAEIARRLGKSKQAIYNLRNRALLRLKNIMTRALEEAGA